MYNIVLEFCPPESNLLIVKVRCQEAHQ